MRRFFHFALPLAFSLAACVPPAQGDPNVNSPSGGVQPMPPSSSLVQNSDSAPTQVSPADPSPHDTSTTPLTIEVHSDCTDSVPLFLGEKPKFGSGTKTSISSNSTTSYPRDSDGTLTIWIIDEQENGLASVKVTKRMKRVDIGRSCRTMDAH